MSSKSEPAGAKGIIEAKKAVRDNDEVALVGRIGGSEKPFEEKVVAFTIVDPQVKPCEDGCPTPWDYCCADELHLKAGLATVKVVDAGGKPVVGGRRIRGCFVPGQAGWSLLSVDYSQIELRILAHYSHDERLLRAFNEGRMSTSRPRAASLASHLVRSRH